MGLRANINAMNQGFPMTADVGDISIPVDYGEAAEVFKAMFLDVARELVPVRTGYLKSTIAAEIGEASIGEVTATASAEYAQYVEFGTYRQMAQPYFIPAIEAALEEWGLAAQKAYEEALEEAQAAYEAEQAQQQSQEAGGAPVGAPVGGGLLGGLALLGLLLIFVIFIEGIKSMFNDTDSRQGGQLAQGALGSALFPNIEIF